MRYSRRDLIRKQILSCRVFAPYKTQAASLALGSVAFAEQLLQNSGRYNP